MSVFANGLEVSGKATPNKTIAAMPDVCMSPPPPPAGPVPIPYPLTGMASDTTDGCTSVFVKGKEAGKKNASKYSKTTGDEPATNSFGAGVVTHKITGPLKFAAYSFDVIFEGGGAERFTDLTTQNHMNTGNASAGISAAQAAAALGADENPCQKLEQANNEAREELANKKKADGSDHASAKEVSEKATITHGVFRPTSGGATHVRACSNKLASSYLEGMAEGLDPNEKTGEKTKKSNACDKSFEYAKARNHERPHTSHTESRIIEDLFNPAKGAIGTGGGVLTLHIDWKTARGKNTTQDACQHCRDLLCSVAGGKDSSCITVKICFGDPEAAPVDVKDTPYCKP